jgi:hypothetical protein
MKRIVALLLLSCFLILSACSPQPAPVVTSTLEPKATPTPQTFKVTFLAFHDYNGNGKQDVNEPSLEGIKIKDTVGECKTDKQGKCDISNHPSSSTHISIIDNREISKDEKMGFLFLSVFDVISISQGLNIKITNNETFLIPLGQGSCLLPFPLDVKYDIYTFFDSDKRERFVGNWKSETDIPQKQGSYYYSYKIRVEDSHYAIDYIFKESIPIVASDTGIISIIRRDENQSNPDDHLINIETYSGLHLDYGHVKPIDSIKVGDSVFRGQVIGYAVTHRINQHFKPPVFMVHIGFFPKNNTNALDPYLSCWTVFKSDISRPSL